MKDGLQTESREDMSPLLTTLVAVLWLALFGGRWLVVPLLLYAGLVSGPDVARWDGGILVQVYLLLLVVTILIAALRAVRGAQVPSAPVSRSSTRRSEPRD
jgi:hypothetical protein